MNQKLTKYAWLLPFFSGICWGAAGIFVRTLEHDGLDNFSIISFRMLLAALITGIWILFYNRHLFYVHRRDFWLFIGSGMIGMTALSVFYNISVTKGSLALSAVLLAMSPVLFLYVAAQTGVNSFFINYAEESIHIEKQTASLYLAFGGMGLFFIGRLAGGVIMNYIQPRLVLLVCAILTFVATLIVVVCSGTLSLIAFFALYLGESIMFPTIFSLALRDAGTKTKLASSLLIMTIVGGAVAPVIMGYIADTTGSMAIAFLIPLVCYGVIGGYAATRRK